MNKILLSALFVGMITLFACSGTKKIVDVIPEETISLEELSIVPEPELEYNASEKRINDLIHTKLEVSFDWKNRYLNGTATLDLEPYFYPTDELVLDAKGFDIKTVKMGTGGQMAKADYQYDDSFLTIDLGKTFLKGEKYQVEIEYTAKPDELAAGGSAAITEAKGLYFINPDGTDPHSPQQIWTQGETEASSCWFPTIDAPNEKTSQEIYMTVQDKYVTLSNGKLISSTPNGDGTRTDYWKQDVPHVPYLFMMAVGEFEIIEDEAWNGKPINYYVEKEYAPYAKKIFGNTKEMIELYSKQLNYDFPWDKYSQIVVREFVSGAMENSSAVVFFDAMNLDDRDLLDETHEDIIAHEMFHHWFGDIVTCESWANLPLNESFATYGEVLWEEHKYGDDAAGLKVLEDRMIYFSEAAEGKKVPMIRYYHEDKEDMFDRHSYQKGGTILHMLRKYVGDDAFFASLNKYLTDNAYQPAEIHHLRLAFEEVTGEDLNWFFNQWFMGSGHPVLEINYRYDEAADMTYVSIEQLQDEDAFIIPMSIDTYKDGKATREDVIIEDRSFEWATKGNPDWINVDAEKSLTCEKTDNKTAEQYAMQYAQGPIFMDRHEDIANIAANSDKDFVQEVMMDAMEDPFWSIRESAILSQDIAALGDATAFKSKLESLATSDDNSAVRAAAFEILGGQSDKAYKSLFKKGLKDSSYAVVAQALNGLVEVDTEGAMKSASELEKTKNGSLKRAIASVYGAKGGEEKLAFFENGLSGGNGPFTRYIMLQEYGNILSRSSGDNLETGLGTLKKLALNDDTWWVRWGGAKALNGLREGFKANQDEAIEQAEKDQIGGVIAAISDLINEIKSNETHPRMSQLMSAWQ